MEDIMRVSEGVERRLLPPPAAWNYNNRTAYKRHGDAVRDPIGGEEPILHVFTALHRIGRNHALRFGSEIGEDYVLGAAWLDMARALIGMLNGETGRLDCGLVDGAIRHMATDYGFDADKL